VTREFGGRICGEFRKHVWLILEESLDVLGILGMDFVGFLETR